MVHDKVERLHLYLPAKCVDSVNLFLAQVHPDIPEGYYELMDSRVNARIMSYDTSVPEDCKVEAHNVYVDIQAAISGGEGISVFDRQRLSPETPYVPEKDVVFFAPDPSALLAHTSNYAGWFTILFPHEAHRPQEHLCPGKHVKKCVIKIDSTLWNDI